VPERNDTGVFQREEYLTAAEAKRYVMMLWNKYSEKPIDTDRLWKALDELEKSAEGAFNPEQVVSRKAMIAALTIAAELEVPAESPNEKLVAPFADIPVNDPLAQTLSPWITAGWIKADAKQKFEPQAPISFSEFKQHAYHVLFGRLAPETIQAVDYRPRLIHDVFNRPNGSVTALAGEMKIATTGTWKIERGQLRSETANRTTYLLSDAGTADVDLSVDFFLEQSGQPAAAGLVVRAVDDKNMQRFLLDTEGPVIRMRVDTLVDGEPTNAWLERRETLRRGFTLRLVAQGNELKYFVEDQLVYQQTSSQFASATQVGVLNGGAVPSRLDNLLVRPVSKPSQSASE
jgi:hypothetical protein